MVLMLVFRDKNMESWGARFPPHMEGKEVQGTRQVWQLLRVSLADHGLGPVAKDKKREHKGLVCVRRPVRNN